MKETVAIKWDGHLWARFDFHSMAATTFTNLHMSLIDFTTTWKNLCMECSQVNNLNTHFFQLLFLWKKTRGKRLDRK
jgi:hypothetical protein